MERKVAKSEGYVLTWWLQKWKPQQKKCLKFHSHVFAQFMFMLFVPAVWKRCDELRMIIICKLFCPDSFFMSPIYFCHRLLIIAKLFFYLFPSRIFMLNVLSITEEKKVHISLCHFVAKHKINFSSHCCCYYYFSFW